MSLTEAVEIVTKALRSRGHLSVEEAVALDMLAEAGDLEDLEPVFCGCDGDGSDTDDRAPEPAPPSA